MKIKPTATPGRVVLEVGTRDESLLGQKALAPFQLKSILVPVDFSECSKKALQYAIPFAQQFGTALVLLNVVQITYPTGEIGPIVPPVAETESIEASRQALASLAQKEIGGRAAMTTLVRVGRPA